MNPRKKLSLRKTQEAHLQQEEKLTFLEQEDAHLQVKTKKTHSHVQRKGTQLHHELKSHLQQKGKKGTHLEEKTETPGLQEKQKKGAHLRQEQEKKTKQKFMWVKGRHSICLPKPNAICSSVHPRISNSSPLLQGQTATSREETTFRIWLRSRGEDDACSTLMMGKSSHGRGLFASRRILAGECILRISILKTPGHHA